MGGNALKHSERTWFDPNHRSAGVCLRCANIGDIFCTHEHEICHDTEQGLSRKGNAKCVSTNAPEAAPSVKVLPSLKSVSVLLNNN